MTPEKKCGDVGGIYFLPKKSPDAKNRVKEARRGGLLGADRSGTR